MPLSFFRKIAIPSNISTYLSRMLIIITVTTALLIGGVLIIQQKILYEKINTQKSKEYTDNQKLYIAETVKNELEYIRKKNELFKQNINSKIKQNVNQAIRTAESIYEKYEEKISEEKLQELIVATISSLKFEMEYEEVFISTLDGTGVYYPRRPDFTGKDLSDFKDANGLPVILEEITLLKRKDEGFLDYTIHSDLTSVTPPNRKICFVKKFGHYNWYFGSKQYVDDYFPKFKDEIAQQLSTVRFRHGGYLFMNHTSGTPIVMDGSVYKGNLNLLTNTDSTRNSVFRQQLNMVKNNPAGGFFYYKWNKINETIPLDKCSYVQLFKEYNWLIGAGFYLDEINQSINDQEKILRRDQQKSIIMILIILFVLLFLEGLIILHFNKRFKSDFERFFNFFYSSQNSFNQLNISALYFDEFKRAGAAANKMIILREETESKLIKEQQKAAESDRLKSAFLANMSHEIRTPMNAILGFSELLEDESQDEQDKVLFVKLIRKNGDTLLSLINDIIDISKIEANLLSVRKRPVKLHEFLDEIEIHYTETLAAKKDKKLQFTINNLTSKDLSVLTDHVRLRQILDNLIGNAIKFTSSGSISIDVTTEEKAICFRITDTGIGIPPDQQVTIFERFMQVEHGLKKNFGGTGLGLAISKNLIELLGGSLQVKSEPGKGSTFYFHIQAN